MPSYNNLFLGLSKDRLDAYTVNNYGLEYSYPIPLIRKNMDKTVRNLLAYPYDKPKFIIFTSSMQIKNDEYFSLNLMEIINVFRHMNVKTI